MSLVLVICRLCEPSSELRIAGAFVKEPLGPVDLLGVDADKINDDRLYRALDELFCRTRQNWKKHIKQRLGELFDLKYDLLLYDMTKHLLRGPSSGERSGRSVATAATTASDCKQVCIALVVSRCGMPVGYELSRGKQGGRDQRAGDRHHDGRPLRQGRPGCG